MAKLSDEELKQLVERIAHNQIPNNGKLVNPLASNNKKNIKQIVLSDAEEFPEDISKWNVSMFVDYFSSKYNKEFGAYYHKTYKQDSLVFKQIMDFFKINALDYKKHTKEFVDWAFNNKKEIIRTEGYFTPQDIFRKINMYYQDEILPSIESGKIERRFIDTTLIEELEKAEKEGKITEIFCRFGIPIGITYLVCYAKKIDEERLVMALKDRIESLYKSGDKGRAQIIRMYKQSISRSPYPLKFKCLNWRSIFRTEGFKDETWWRDYDYGGVVPSEYEVILNGTTKGGE